MSIRLDEVEFANEAFYLAFEAKDFEAMTHLWSEERLKLKIRGSE